MAVDFVSSSSQYFNATLVPMPPSFTVMVWAKSKAAAWNTYGSIGSSRGANGFIMHNNAASTTMDVYVYDTGGALKVFLTAQPCGTITDWQHYAFTLDDPTDTGILSLNGAQIGSNTVSLTRTNTARNVFFAWDDGQAGRYFDGYQYDARIYSRALSPSEIKIIYEGRGVDRITNSMIMRAQMDGGPDGALTATNFSDLSPSALTIATNNLPTWEEAPFRVT